MEGDNAKNQLITDIVFGDARILEMVLENTLINVPVDNSINIDAITADDPDPKFVNIEIIRSGISVGNNRRYTNDIVRQINDMVPGTHGFFGHPDPSKYGFEFREPQCIYVGSIIDTMQDGIQRCIAKAYLFKTSNLREWVPKSIAAGKPMTVSINGRGDIIRNGDYVDVVAMNVLESIDWANPGTEGMFTSQAMSVVSEMQNLDGGIGSMETKEIIKNITVTEFKAYNQDGYNAILGGVTITELSQINPNLVKQIEESAKITELALKIDGAEKSVKITELQSTIDSMESKITELQGKVEDVKLTEFKNKKLVELVPEGMREKIGARVSGKDEASIEASINTEIAYVREMGGLDNLPGGMGQHVGSDDVKAAVASMFSGSKKEDK